MLPHIAYTVYIRLLKVHRTVRNTSSKPKFDVTEAEQTSTYFLYYRL